MNTALFPIICITNNHQFYYDGGGGGGGGGGSGGGGGGGGGGNGDGGKKLLTKHFLTFIYKKLMWHAYSASSVIQTSLSELSFI